MEREGNPGDASWGHQWLGTEDVPRTHHGSRRSWKPFLVFWSGDQPWEMLLQARPRAHNGGKTLSGGRKGSENLPRDPASRVVSRLSVNVLSLPIPQLALEWKGVM